MVFEGRLKGVDYSGMGKGRLKWFSAPFSDGLCCGCGCFGLKGLLPAAGRVQTALHAFHEYGVDAVAQGVHQYNVVFLDAGGARVGDVEQYVAILQHLGDFATVASC